jgi:hypothetical protein
VIVSEGCLWWQGSPGLEDLPYLDLELSSAAKQIYVQFYESKLNTWGKYGADIYDEFIKML